MWDLPDLSPSIPRARPRQIPGHLSGEPATELFNGFGGFVDDGREYAIRVNGGAGRLPPAPWTNVIANGDFGFACTESGPGYTWSVNSHDNRLTPWRNDPVSDAPGEALFIRDDESGELSGRRRRCRPAARMPTPRATAMAIRRTSTAGTASSPSSCSSFRRITR